MKLRSFLKNKFFFNYIDLATVNETQELKNSELKLHPKVEEDLKELDNALQLQVFKKLKRIQNSPEFGFPHGNKTYVLDHQYNI